MIKKYRDFESAREFAKTLKFNSAVNWHEFSKSEKIPSDVPKKPNKIYKDKGWISWYDWLGISKSHKKQFRDFESAREFARSLKLSGQIEWTEYRKSGNKPEDIPSAPDQTYKNKGWVNWGDWLGTKNQAPRDREFRDFESAREFIHKLKIKNGTEWSKYCKSGNKPDNIPSAPWHVYKNKGWINRGDWFGTGNVQYKQFRDFESAKKFVQKLELKSAKEWTEYRKSGNKPEDIPSNPHQTYKNNGWISMGDWLGTNSISNQDLSKQYLPFKEAREEARQLAKQYNIKNWEDWRNAVKNGLIPKNLPNFPWQSYKKKRKKNGKK